MNSVFFSKILGCPNGWLIPFVKVTGCKNLKELNLAVCVSKVWQCRKAKEENASYAILALGSGCLFYTVCVCGKEILLPCLYHKNLCTSLSGLHQKENGKGMSYGGTLRNQVARHVTVTF